MVHGDYAIGGYVLELQLLWRAFFFPPVRFSFNGGQAGEQYTVAQPFWTSFCPQAKNENELNLKYIWPLIECVSRLSQDLLLCTLRLMHVSKQTIQIYIYLPIFHLTLYYIQPFESIMECVSRGYGETPSRSLTDNSHRPPDTTIDAHDFLISLTLSQLTDIKCQRWVWTRVSQSEKANFLPLVYWGRQFVEDPCAEAKAN